MMKKYLPFLVLIVCIAFANCNKKPLPPTVDGPVEFAVDAQINGVQQKFEAGKNNLYMHTNFFNYADNVLGFSGTIGDATKPDSNDYFKITFKSYDGSQSPIIDSMFQLGDYYSYSLDTNTTQLIVGKAVQFTFNGITQNVASYLWNFGDGTTSTSANPYHIYTLGGKVSVSCLVQYNNNIQDFLQNDIDVSNGTNCAAQFSIYKLGNDSLLCTANSGSGNYKWYLPNGDSIIGGSTISYNQPILLRNYISLLDLGACGTTYKQVVAPNNSLALANFNYVAKDTSFINTLPPQYNFRAVVLEYVNNGKRYLSYKNDASIDQSTKKIFALTNKQLYQKNTVGQRTVKLTGSTNTFLYNVANNNDSIPIVSNKLQIAVAFP
jgi:PKD domain